MNSQQAELLMSSLWNLRRAVAMIEAGKTKGLSRTDVGDIRMTINAALCKINELERRVVGVPPPPVGD